MKHHKAPGKDGVLTNFLQAALEEQAPDNETGSDCPMTDALATILNYSYDYSIIPRNWQECAMAGLPPKDGDLANISNYQGISLMSSTLNLLLVILSDPINHAGEAHALFHPA